MTLCETLFKTCLNIWTFVEAFVEAFIEAMLSFQLYVEVASYPNKFRKIHKQHAHFPEVKFIGFLDMFPLQFYTFYLL